MLPKLWFSTAKGRGNQLQQPGRQQTIDISNYSSIASLDLPVQRKLFENVQEVATLDQTTTGEVSSAAEPPTVR
jgi:hypothetical protein